MGGTENTPNVIATTQHTNTTETRHKLTTTRHRNTLQRELQATATPTQCHRNRCTSSAAPQWPKVSNETQIISFPDLHSLSSPWTDGAKSSCRVILSHLLSLQNKLIHADVFTSRGQSEKSHAQFGGFTTAHSTNIFLPLSARWRLFRLLFSSHNPTFLQWLVYYECHEPWGISGFYLSVFSILP